jgi:predicted  nucleic acid-binding Zn-ribbon protein
MGHQCVHCGKLYPDASKELLTGCSCGSHFFYYIKKEYYDRLNRQLAENARRVKEEEKDKDREKEEGFMKTLGLGFGEDENIRGIQEKIEQINKLDKIKIEKDVRDIIGISEKEDVPVILDLESIRILGPGKFEIDVVNLFSKKRPLIYKLEEGKYIIDLASTLKLNASEVRELGNKIKNPEKK